MVLAMADKLRLLEEARAHTLVSKSSNGESEPRKAAKPKKALEAQKAPTRKAAAKRARR